MVGKILAVLALVLLPLSGALWHKSHRHPENFRYDLTLYKSVRVYLQSGTCGLRLLSMPTKTASRTSFQTPLVHDPIPSNRSFLLSSVRQGPFRITWLVFPFWMPTVLLLFFGIMPILQGPVRRWWRHINGLCLDCAYDLRGTRSGRCPECGLRYR